MYVHKYNKTAEIELTFFKKVEKKIVFPCLINNIQVGWPSSF